uniref:Coenzyme Q-binding protein COQ10 START domain-containing protein n=1 Tax=Aureoumbra lagunensis TaxID=44058 RepID=A0A7S3JYI1_9STRA|mmetsp:Transcript_19166/g.24868  ORF Transcript_19166/g.24868 Transcript_19166/m.24868 type:complete len:584 (+) Transcript_19166:71-1822(+)
MNELRLLLLFLSLVPLSWSWQVVVPSVRRHERLYGGEVRRRSSRNAPEVSQLDEDICLVPGEVFVRVDVAPGNARRIYTGVDISADADTVYDLLTDYEALGKVVPNLIANEVLRKVPGGARLRQVGAAQVLPGINFRASMILDVRELPNGMSESELFQGDLAETMNIPLQRGVFPRPWAASSIKKRKDVAMQSVVGEPGDFTLYQGLWRAQPLPECAPDGRDASRLTFSVEIQPRPWLPVALVESRIAQDLVKNMEAVAAEAMRRANRKNVKNAIPGTLAITKTVEPLPELVISAREALLATLREKRFHERSALGVPPEAVSTVQTAAERLRQAAFVSKLRFELDPKRLKGNWNIRFSSELASAFSTTNANRDKRSTLPRLASRIALKDIQLEIHDRNYDLILIGRAPINLPPPALRVEHLFIAPKSGYDATLVQERIRVEARGGSHFFPRPALPARFLKNVRSNIKLTTNINVIYADDTLFITSTDDGELRICDREHPNGQSSKNKPHLMIIDQDDKVSPPSTSDSLDEPPKKRRISRRLSGVLRRRRRNSPKENVKQEEEGNDAPTQPPSFSSSSQKGPLP